MLAYLGVRRRAASQPRWHDLNLDHETARFKEKGGKVITKPLPYELAALLRFARESKEVPAAPDDYVIPMARKRLKDGELDPRVIWRTVVRVSSRATQVYLRRFNRSRRWSAFGTSPGAPNCSMPHG